MKYELLFVSNFDACYFLCFLYEIWSVLLYSPSRDRGLSLCGWWSLSDAESMENSISKLEMAGKFEKSACLALFHLDLRYFRKFWAIFGGKTREYFVIYISYLELQIHSVILKMGVHWYNINILCIGVLWRVYKKRRVLSSWRWLYLDSRPLLTLKHRFGRRRVILWENNIKDTRIYKYDIKNTSQAS